MVMEQQRRASMVMEQHRHEQHHRRASMVMELLAINKQQTASMVMEPTETLHGHVSKRCVR